MGCEIMIYCRYDPVTFLPIGVEMVPLPPDKTVPLAKVISEGSFEEISSNVDSMCIVHNGSTFSAVVDGELALKSAIDRAIEYVRKAVADELTNSDIKIRSLDELLRLDRSNESAVEEWYSVAGSRQRVRNSSNICQIEIQAATSPASAWEIAIAFDKHSSHPIEPAPEITKNAFLRRLNLSVPEKLDPVFQALTSDLIVLGYVDLRQAAQTVQFLVSVGKISQERADQILNNPIRWGERPIHGV